MDFDQFAEIIKEKHPEYKDRDNLTLAKAIVAKYPEYKDRVTFEQPLKADDQGNAPTNADGTAAGTPQQQIDFERGGFNKFSTSPVEQRLVENASEAISGVGMGMLGGAVAKGALKLGGKVIGKAADTALPSVSKVGQVIESMGSKGQNYAAGIKEKTVEMMTKAGETTGEVGQRLGTHLAENKIVGATPKETEVNLLAAHKQAGEEVGKAIDVINKGDTTINAETALKPLQDAMQERLSAATSARKLMGKPFKEVYDSLIKKAKDNNGFVDLEDVRKVMNEVGPMTHKGSEETQAAMSELYGTLANVQDGIITQISKSANNPSIRQALLDANKKYSLYSRILPDIKRAAAKESVGKSSFLAHPGDAAKHFAATKASGMMARQGSRMQAVAKKASKDFPISEFNKAELDKMLEVLKRAK